MYRITFGRNSEEIPQINSVKFTGEVFGEIPGGIYGKKLLKESL